RCPLCRFDLARRKLTQAVVARWEVDCPSCKGRLRLNVHPAENGLLLASFGMFAGLAALAYFLQRDALYGAAFIIAIIGTAAVPLLERVVLREWPRYVPAR